LIADQKTQCWIYLSINQRNPNSDHAKASSEHGVVHYLALTFSTLLSSQVSGAHRAEFFVLGLGQRPTVRGLGGSSQIRSFLILLTRTSCSTQRGVSGLRIR
jgi:hypothetical protein